MCIYVKIPQRLDQDTGFKAMDEGSKEGGEGARNV